MRAEYAADLYRRYQTFVKSPANQTIQKIAPGANVDDYHWTEVMMREAGKLVSGVSIHYYTSPGPLTGIASAPRRTSMRRSGRRVLSKALYMDELITKHSAIMDKYDPEKKVGLMVDEWGNVVPRPARSKSALPASAEQSARCAGRGDTHQHLQPAQ